MKFKAKTALLAGGLLSVLGLVILGPALAQCPGINCAFNQAISIPVDGIRNSYSASFLGLTPASSATDVAKICGSATRLVRVTKVEFSGRATTAVSADIILVKRSAVNTGGTAVSMTNIPYDSGFSAASAVAQVYSANPTVGAAVGDIGSRQYFLGNLTTTISQSPIVWLFGDRPSSAVILRGVAQCLTVNLDGVSYSGGVLDIGFEWTEE